jgi:adenine-specific DNA-methyltransferase
MAKLAVQGRNPPVRILDPGGGSGILSCAVCEELSKRQVVKRVEIDTYENDPALVRVLHGSLVHASRWLEKRGIRLDFKIVSEEFVLSAMRARRDACWRSYDLVIANPPYSKISAMDPRARAVSEVVYGQPNLYTLFMAASMRLLKDSGVMVFITPRSYATGHYFSGFRKAFFAEMSPIRIHVFESRKDVFSEQSVLQESVILKAEKAATQADVCISASKDSGDIGLCCERKVSLPHVLFRTRRDVVLRLPLDVFDDLVMEIVDSWVGTLVDYDLCISTGPVVPFRAKDFIPDDVFSTRERLVPLLWMQNVQPMRTIWPCDGLRGRDASHQFIIQNSETRRHKLVLHNRNMVLLRRFSAKEQRRRLTAAPLFREQLKSEFIGIENHLNYIHRRMSEMSRDETEGLAAILNSDLLDRYFRICNGNTQVNATELKTIRLPPLDLVKKLGTMLLANSPVPELNEIDEYIWGLARGYTKRKSLLERLLSETYKRSANNLKKPRAAVSSVQ